MPGGESFLGNISGNLFFRQQPFISKDAGKDVRQHQCGQAGNKYDLLERGGGRDLLPMKAKIVWLEG